MDAYVEPHLAWRLLGPDDAEDLDQFRDQLDALEDSVLSGVAASITGRNLLVAHAVGGFDSYQSLSAYGVTYIAETDPPRMYLMGGVHPTHRHLHIGTALLHWQMTHAAAWRDEFRPGQPLWLGCYAELGRPGLARVASHLGFTPERYSYDLQRDLTVPLTVPTVDGVLLEPFETAHSEPVRQLHNVCFDGMGKEVTRETWAARVADPDFRPEWSFIARAGDEVVGYAMSGLGDTEDDGTPIGWIERFGVHPAYRGRKISLALMGHCLLAMRDAGCREAGIGIDTPDGVGVQRLCADLGWTTRDAVALLSKVVP
ncbi:GNAT family N-acetyltransferase [Tessaracoccus sp. Z1128]